MCVEKGLVGGEILEFGGREARFHSRGSGYVESVFVDLYVSVGRVN